MLQLVTWFIVALYCAMSMSCTPTVNDISSAPSLVEVEHHSQEDEGIVKCGALIAMLASFFVYMVDIESVICSVL